MPPGYELFEAAMDEFAHHLDTLRHADIDSVEMQSALCVWLSVDEDGRMQKQGGVP